MKKILTVAAVSLLATLNLQAETNNVEMCKAFIEQGKQYKETMKNDKVSNATLAFYKDQVVTHCGNIVAKVQYEENFFPKLMVKDNLATVDTCKTSINMAKEYAASNSHNSKMLDVYKENIVDNCGTLVAKKTPAFCMFDVVDTSDTDTLKELCVAAIEKAHTAKDTKTLALHKADVIQKCGRLQAAL